MADITLKLIWYRLGESYANMADRYERFLEWYEDFSWRRVDILDMLFLGWLLAAFLVVGLINLYLRLFGRLRGGKGLTGLDGWGRGPGVGAGGAGESCSWMNSALSWLYLHLDHTPAFVDSWLKALNDHIRKQAMMGNSVMGTPMTMSGLTAFPPQQSHHDNFFQSQRSSQGGEVQVKIERLQSGSLPPKFTSISTSVSPQDTLTLMSQVESSDLTFLVSTLQQTGASIKVSNCDVTVQKLLGQLKVVARYGADQVDVTSQWITPPQLTMTVKQRSFESNVDPKRLETIIREAISNAVTNFTVSPKSALAGFYSPSKSDTLSTPSAAPMTSLAGNRDLMTLRNRRLLVKVIKANSLGEKEFGCSDPYCLVSMDSPPQKHSTSVVRNTNNPFWDEHFLFDLEDITRNIKFEVYDREKTPGEDFLGQAVLPMSDLRRMPSSRQIVPLQSRNPGIKSSSGSITVEFLFMEPAEAQQMQLNASSSHRGDLSDSLSPRRRIDTNRTVTPGGTIVTKKTTTTEKPRDIRLDSSYAESPSRIQKTDSTSNFRSDTSPYSSQSSQLALETSTSASQVGSHAGPSLESPKLTVTQAYAAPPGGQYSSITQPMSDITPTDEYGRERRSHSTVSAGTGDPREKKSRGLASAFRRRFGRGPKKARSHSADRASSFREGSLLKPPEQTLGHRTTDDMGLDVPYVARSNIVLVSDDLDTADIPMGNMRTQRSQSFSNSLKRIFRKKKKGEYPSSRESSVSRMSARGYDTSREPSVSHPSPHMSGRTDPYARDPYAYQDLSPDVAARREIEDRDYPYSRSMPVATPLYDR